MSQTRATKTLYRTLDLDRTKIDLEKRTVPLAFSSEAPVERWGENEVLSHDDGDYDLARLNNGAPLLLNHDPRNQIGVVEAAEISKGDKKGRAVVRFSKNKAADEVFQDVVDGIRSKVSFGYDHTGLVKSDEKPGEMPTRRYRWAAHEISIVSVPADDNVGIGRGSKVDSLTFSDAADAIQNLTPEQKMKLRTLLLDKADAGGNGPATVDAAEKSKIELGAVNAYKERAKKIRAAAEGVAKGYRSESVTAKLRNLADEAIEKGASLEDFNADLLAALPDVRKLETTSADIGMDQRDLSEYSLMRAIRTTVHNHENPNNKESCFEFEVSQTCSKTYERKASGFWIPNDFIFRGRTRHMSAETRDALKRDLQVNIFGQGGAFVPTLLETTPIEILRNAMVLKQLGIRIMGGLTGNVAIPRQTGAATAYSLGEIALATLSTQSIDQIPLAPKRVAVTNNYSKQLLIQSSVDVENFMRSDMMEVQAIKADYLGFNGAGSNSEPLGVVNQPGVSSVVFGGSATFAKLVSFETALAVLNANRGSRAYVTTPAAKGVLKSAAKLLTGATTVAAVALWENDEINGYPAFDTNNILNNQMIFGNWNDFIMGLFGGVDVVVDPYTLAKNAEVAITTNMWLDIAIRHAQSFCISADAANQ